MEPNRLENEFKKKLEQRTIQPTEMAWDRLDAMLSVTEEKRKPKRAWMYIAASFLGFLLLGTIFLKQGGESTNRAVPETQTVAAGPVKHEEPATNNTRAIPQTTVTPQEINAENNEAVAVTSVKSNNKNITDRKPSVKTEIINTPAPLNEAIANVNKNIEINKPLTNEPENLLAQSAEQNDMANKKSSIKVNANSLLSSVEGELDDSFKNKALQSAVKNFNTVRSSLANRNHK